MATEAVMHLGDEEAAIRLISAVAFDTPFKIPRLIAPPPAVTVPDVTVTADVPVVEPAAVLPIGRPFPNVVEPPAFVKTAKPVVPIWLSPPRRASVREPAHFAGCRTADQEESGGVVNAPGIRRSLRALRENSPLVIVPSS
jgi:hypothetical protein